MVAATESPGRTIGRYRVEAEIGRGMMGVVYRALDPNLARTVALKTIQLAFAVSEEEREVFGRRFLSEARAAARLSHPGIVVVHDVGRDADAGSLYIAFEYLRGRTLADLTSGGARLDWRQALGVTARIAGALQHAHAQGIVHRDVKPANIMVLESGEAKIMDFGIAKVPAERLTSTGQFWGTPSYMSPEQASGAPLDGRSDLFSLAAVLYLLLTGRAVFEGGSVPATLSRVLFQDPAPPSQLVPELPPVVDRILARALAKRPADRYPDGAALAQDLEDVLHGREPRHLEGLPTPGVGGTHVPARVSERPGSERPDAEAAPDEPVGDLAPGAGARVWNGRHGLLLIAAVGLAGLVGAFLLPIGSELPGLAVPGIVRPAQLEINFAHSLRSGTLKVWVDEELMLEEPLESWVKEDLVVVKVRSGRETKTLALPPGEHEVRLQVQGDGFSGTRRIRGDFEGGSTRRLEAKLGGLLRKELSLWWVPAVEAEGGG